MNETLTPQTNEPREQTGKSLSEWSDEQLRVKVAELHGARWMRGAMGYRFLSFAPVRFPEHKDWNFADGTEPIASPAFEGWDIPNYPADLNDMHEAEKALKYERLPHYVHILRHRVLMQPEGVSDFDLMHATARKRAEAFVAALTTKEQKP